MKHGNDGNRGPVVARDPKEILKQATTYADAITAFSLAQSVAFGLATGTSCYLATQIQNGRPYVLLFIGLAFVVYTLALHLCHRNEDRLAGKPDSTPVGAAVIELRVMRYVLLVFAFSLAAFVGWTGHPSGRAGC